MAGSEGSSSRNSHKRSSLEKEDFVFDCKDEEGELTEEDALDSGEELRFRPFTPKAPPIELRGREVIFAIATFFLFSVSIGLIVVLASNRQQQETAVENGKNVNHKDSDLCVSRECLRAAASIVQDMDQTVDPCQDFWNYACGGWLKRHSIPASYSSWSVDSDIVIDMDKRIKEILESPVDRDFSKSAERKAKLMYRKCMDVDTIDAAGIQPILEIINSFGGWAIKDDWNIGQKSGLWNFQRFLQSLHFNYWVDVFFAVFVSPDDKASHKNVIQVDQGRLGISFERREDDPVFEGYKNYMREVARLFGASNNDVEQFVNATFAFEKRMSEIRVSDSAEERMNPELMYNPLTIGELQRLAPRVNWVEFLGYNFTRVSRDTVVLITSRAYFANMSSFLQNTDQRVLNYYMVWRLILHYAKHLSKPFRKAAEKFDAVLEGRHREKPRYKFCLDGVDDLLGQAVGALFIRDYFSTSSKDEIMGIIKNIKATFKDRIKRLPWMDEETKAEALKKLKKINYRIGYPQFLENLTMVDHYYRHLSIKEEASYFDYCVQSADYQVARMVEGLEGREDGKHEWEMNPHELNAYFSVMENIMVFPAGILQAPYYRNEVPLYLNYGAIGAIIGHELIHGFDTLGSNYDSKGNLRTWWSVSSWADFENRTSCLIDFYNDYSYEGLHVDGTHTQAENVADIGGLKQTFHAYRKYVKQKKAQSKLPGLDLSEEKMFFVAFGQNWCKKQTKENLMSDLRQSEHTPNKFRLSGTLSQMKEFADTFKCKAGTPMNPRKKCNIW